MNSETQADAKPERSLFFDLLERQDFIEGDYWQTQTFEVDAMILREGDYSGKIFLIIEGSARVLGDVNMGDDYHVHPGIKDLKPGEVFGEFALLDRNVHSATVRALTACKLAVIDNDKLLGYLETNQDIGYQIYRHLAVTLVRNMRASHNKILSLLAWGFKAHGYEKYMKTDV